MATMVCILLGAGRVAAQEPRRVGVTVVHPAAVGVIWHATERVAIRPDFGFSKTAIESGSSAGPFPLSITSDGWSVNTGLSVLYYAQRWDHVRTYVSPRVSYSRSTSATSSLLASRLTSRSRGWSASYGAQYLPTERFSVFAEAGLSVTYSKSESSASTFSTTGHTWGTRAGMGVVVYF